MLCIFVSLFLPDGFAEEAVSKMIPATSKITFETASFIFSRRLSLIALQQCPIVTGAFLLCCKIYPKDIIEIGYRCCEH